MTIYICGGSNSLKSKGWVAHFKALLPPDQKLVNLSIGAAPSTMGAYRCIFTITLKPGDVVIWEYGINDARHIDHKSYPEELLMRSVEYMIRHCQTNGARFLPVIFQTRNRERMRQLGRYRALLHQMFNTYKLAYFDLSQAYCAAHDTDRIPLKLYKNRMHYDLKNPLMDFIAKGALGLLNSPTGHPVPRQPIWVGADIYLRLHQAFMTAERDDFSSSALTSKAWRPRDRTMQLAPFQTTGTVVALLVVATPRGGAMDVGLGEDSFCISLSFNDKDFDKPMFKLITLPLLMGRKLAFRPGDTLRFTWTEDSADILADDGFKAHPGAKALAGRQARIVGVMTEETL